VTDAVATETIITGIIFFMTDVFFDGDSYLFKKLAL
jgi:hypothetical protein